MNKFLHLCRADPSEFVRRAAVKFVSRFLCSGTMLVDCLVTVCEAVVHDVDCDVKSAAVRFWRQYLPNIEQSITASCCQTAVLAGSVSSLLLAVSDCDRAVRMEALKTLVDIRRLVETQPDLLLPEKQCSAGQVLDDSSCVRICTNPDFVEAGLKNLPQNFEVSRDEVRSTLNDDCDDTDADRVPRFADGDMIRIYSESAITRLRVRLLSTDWNSLLASESQQSDDCHAGNPISLLDDILRTARRDGEVSSENGDKDDQDSVVIDCY